MSENPFLWREPGVVSRGITIGVCLMVVSMGAHADDAADRVQAILDRVETMEGEFIQSRVQDGQLTWEGAGRLSLKRPGLFRWHYDTPNEQIIVGDGKHVWIYDVDLDQVSVQNAERALRDTPAAVLVSERTVASMFEVTDLGKAEGVHWYRLIPGETGSGYEALQLGIRRNALSHLRMEDGLGRVTDIAFESVQRNFPIEDSVFAFVPPEGVDVIGDIE